MYNQKLFNMGMGLYTFKLKLMCTVYGASDRYDCIHIFSENTVTKFRI